MLIINILTPFLTFPQGGRDRSFPAFGKMKGGITKKIFSFINN